MEYWIYVGWPKNLASLVVIHKAAASAENKVEECIVESLEKGRSKKTNAQYTTLICRTSATKLQHWVDVDQRIYKLSTHVQ